MITKYYASYRPGDIVVGKEEVHIRVLLVRKSYMKADMRFVPHDAYRVLSPIELLSLAAEEQETRLP